MTQFLPTAIGYYRQTPTSSPQELAKFYQEKYYQLETRHSSSYSDEELRWFDLAAAVSDHVCAAWFGGSRGSLLDIGCGEGFLMHGMARRGWSVSGYDFSDFGIAQQNAHLMNRFERGDIYELIARDIGADKKYDVANLTNLLEHVRDPESLMREVRSIVKNQGLVLINVPNDFSDLQKALLATGKVDREYWLAPMEHLNYFTRASLTSMLAECGWNVIQSLSDFPIEHFLLHSGSNYVLDGAKGKQAHEARMFLDLHFSKDLAAYVRLLEAQAACGMGRAVIVVATPSVLP